MKHAFTNLLVAAGVAVVGAAEIDVSKLPQASTQPVDFAADIRPIFEASCLRCHGVERPRSRFSLASRDAALRGGDSGIAIVPGKSAESPLIHYVAGLEPGMEMPPEGKGDPLTPAQVGLLRAWIDQGAKWSQMTNENAVQFSVTPALRWVTVIGNARQFQEHHWLPRGVSGGAAHFRIAQKLTNNLSIAAEGHALTDDYRITLDIRRADTAYGRFGFEQHRRYYNDNGPYFPFRASGFATQVQRIFDLDRDLHLDTGKAFAELGLTLPHWPQITLGYEYHYKEGAKSIEQWGPVTQNTGGSNVVRSIFPAYKEINEDVHVLRLDVAGELDGVELEDNFRAEFSDIKTRRTSATSFGAGNVYPEAFTITRETHEQIQWANSLQGSKAVRDWLHLSGGYLFSQIKADASFRQDTSDAVGRPAAGTFWLGRDVVLEESAHVFNVGGQAGPWDGLTGVFGVEAAFSDSEGFGDTDLRESDPLDPTFPVSEPAMVRMDTHRASASETLAVRYTKIPYTTLFADGRLKQEQINRWEEQNGGHHDFLSDTDIADRWQEFRAGFDVSPSRVLSLHAAYKKRHYLSEYDHLRDEQPHGTAGEGYPAFIRSRDSDSDLVEARVSIHPTGWLKATLSYRWGQTEYETSTDPVNTPAVSASGGTVFAGRHDSASYSGNVTLTPWQRWSISTTFTYQDSRIEAHDNGSHSVAPYRGDLYSVLMSATFVVDPKTDLSGGYSFSRARYGQDNAAAGLPLGIDYDLHAIQAGIRRKLSDHASASLNYGIFDYAEPTAGGFNDYTAHMIFALVTIRLP